MGSGSKYLLQKGDAWAFRIAIPRTLRGQFLSKKGKPLVHITRGLGTSKQVAVLEAGKLESEWTLAFRRAKRGTPLSLEEIDEEAGLAYDATLKRLEAEAKGNAKLRKPSMEQELEDLEHELGLVFFPRYENPDTWQNVLEQLTDFEPFAYLIEGVESRKHVPIKPDTDADTYRLLARALIRANVWAIEGRMKRAQGQPSERPATFLGAAGIDPLTLQPRARSVVPIAAPVARSAPRGGVGFLEASERFLAERQRDPSARGREQSLRQYQNAFRLFADHSNNAPLVAVDRKMAAGFLDTVATLSPKWGQSPRAKGLPLHALLKEFSGQLSNSSLNHYVSALKTFFDWASDRGDFVADNPFARQSRKTTVDGWKPYTVTELNQLFGGALFTEAKERLRPNADPMLWVPLVALFSGLRVEEICQLRREDVKQEGVGYFNVTDEGEGQKLKSKAAKRRVPIHTELVRCGFLAYLKGCDAVSLWPGLKPGGPDKRLSLYFSKRFTAYRRAVGIVRAQTSFHSLRKNFTTALDNADVHQGNAAVLLGHTRGFTFDTYSGGKELQALQAMVERVGYPGLVLDHLHVAL
jgi:integrase